MFRLSVSALAILAATSASFAGLPASTVVYEELFEGGSGALLHGTTEDTTATLWSANNFVNDNGTINGANEGSALLPFDPITNRVYTLSMDVNNTTDRWIALGFARDPLTSPGASFTNDRLSNETEGIAWMLYRKHASDVTQDVQLFAGLRTNGGIADNNIAHSFNQTNNLSVIIDTYGAGTNFKVDYLINGLSILPSGPVTVNIPVADINYTGFAFDNSTTAAVSVDNFRLSVVPEPTSLAALVGLGMFARRRRA